MNQPDNIQIVKSLFDSFNQRTLEKGVESIDDKLAWTDVATGEIYRGKDGYAVFYQRWLSAFPDGKIEILNTLSSGDSVVVEYMGRGTQTGTLVGASGELPPTGRHVELRICEIYDFNQGQLIQGRSYYDLMTLLHQLGALERPKAA